jgi:hypothetical protein
MVDGGQMHSGDAEVADLSKNTYKHKKEKKRKKKKKGGGGGEGEGRSREKGRENGEEIYFWKRMAERTFFFIFLLCVLM